MYIPAHFAADDLEQVAAFVEHVGAADFVTFDGAELTASLLPVIWDRSVGENGRLLAHLALTNQQWKTALPDVPALAIVHGLQAYISPTWYASTAEHGRVVPTWNYQAVHFTGVLTFHPDAEWLRAVVKQLTDKYEAHRANRWYVEDAPDAYIEGQLRGIVGIEMTITKVEAKNKLSQNRSMADQLGAIDGLMSEPDPQAQEIAAAMRARISEQVAES
ncbi:MAG TPA: FMN-binding negative transcriptional regulator [Acidothermaceae bacterium]|nr:FMN-binding negative transcriptional regulator [Acidothermaceae bacterium]